MTRVHVVLGRNSKSAMEHRVILFDFDGVLCKDQFYKKALLPKYTELYNWIQVNIFGDNELVQRWMRGEVNSYKINSLINRNTKFDYELLKKLFEDSVRAMKVDKEMLEIARSLRSSGTKIGIVTDNMDAFTNITVPNYKLDTIFDVIVNSADYGMLKKEQNGKLFDVALTKLGEKIEDSLLIDDSESTIESYKQKGGHGFVYRDITELKSFLENSL